MEIFWEGKKKDIFQELEILTNLLTILKESQDILSLPLISEKLELIFVMEDIILFIGWVSDWTELKLFSILLLQLMDYLSLFGEFRPEMQLLLTIISVLVSTELELKFSLINLQVEIAKKLTMILVTSMEALMLQLLMEAGLLL